MRFKKKAKNLRNCLKVFTSKKSFGSSSFNIVCFQAAPGLKEGFWSNSKTEISFFGRQMLINDQFKTDSASMARRRIFKKNIKCKVKILDINLTTR